MAADKYLDEFDPIKVRQEDGSVVSGIFKAYQDRKSVV